MAGSLQLPKNLPPSFRSTSGRLPDGMLEAVLALANGEVKAAAPKAAATVVVLRDSANGVEAYLLRRAGSMAFAAGATVFPGGSVDPRDQELPASAFVGCDLAAWGAALGADELLIRSLICAAVRETFEESGVILAGPSETEVVDDASGEDWEADRLALLDRSLSLAELLTRRGLLLRADLLRPWAHWITPEIEPRRYDTRFFVAALPTGQRTRDVGGEADAVIWQTPLDALAQAEAREVMMLPPTAFTLAEISEFDTVTAVLDSAASRQIHTVEPQLVVEDGVGRLLTPYDEGATT